MCCVCCAVHVLCVTGDSISGLADAWGVDAFELLYNNSASIDDISKPLDGIVLRVCGISKSLTWVGCEA